MQDIAYKIYGWLGGVVVSVLDSRSRGPEFDPQPVHRQATTLGKLLTPMCLCHQAVQFGTSQRAVMLCGREGNRSLASIVLSMRHRLYRFIVAKVREMSTLPIRSFGHGPLYFFLQDYTALRRLFGDPQFHDLE